MNYCNCPNCRTENCPNARTPAERIAELEAENHALRTLMNTYNLGGWTDAFEPMKRAEKAEATLATARQDERERCERVCIQRAKDWGRDQTHGGAQARLNYAVEAHGCAHAIHAITNEVAK